jgi:hypothetical protein
MVDRMYQDQQRAIAKIKVNLAEAEFMLSPPRGHPPELTYCHALQDLQANPALTVRELAKKYFPGYFPGRAKEACTMMGQGLRRARKKKQSPSR